MTTRMIQRRGLASQWTAINPILEIGELGFEEDTKKFKIGDGESSWSTLPYFVNETAIPDTQTLLATINQQVQSAIQTSVSTAVAGLVDSAPASLNTLNELASAIADDATFANTITTALANKADSTHSHTLDDLSDVSVASATTGQVLQKQSNGTWSPASLSSAAVSYSDLTNVPTTFTPSSHTHNASEIANTTKDIADATYSTIASDNGKTLIFSPTASVAITVANVLSVGQRIDLYLRGTSATFTAGSGVTIEGAGSTGVALKMMTKYTSASIICVAAGVYAIIGAVELG